MECQHPVDQTFTITGDPSEVEQVLSDLEFLTKDLTVEKIEIEKAESAVTFLLKYKNGITQKHSVYLYQPKEQHLLICGRIDSVTAAKAEI